MTDDSHTSPLEPSTNSAPGAVPGPGATRLGSLACLAGLLLAWSIVQWRELFTLRHSGSAFCLGGGDCAAAWDSPLALAIREATGVPVVGWGVVWSISAALLPLWTLWQLARGRAGSAGWAATGWVALLGAAAAALLAGSLAWLGVACLPCLVGQLSVAAYAAICLGPRPRPRLRSLRQALGPLGLAAVAAFALVALPALRTPHSESDSRALRALTADAEQDRPPLLRMLGQLDDTQRRNLRSELERWRRAPEIPSPAPRSLIGPRQSPVRLTEFADTLCGHCAALHEVLVALRNGLPQDAFALESRHFPLDSACNPHVPGPSRNPIRCEAARLLICSEGQPYAFELAGRIFAHQRELDEERLFQLAEPWVSRGALANCMASARTQERLRDDIAWATQTGIEGTPWVLINGRRGSAYPPFLAAVLLARGDPEDPLLVELVRSR